MPRVDDLIGKVKSHRLFAHPMWDHWEKCTPPVPVSGAMFHQIQKFCASTRPGFVFPEGLRNLGWFHQSSLIEEIVASEDGHGAHLALMAGHIVNRSAGIEIFPDAYAQRTVEAGLKTYSDQLLGSLPGYDRYEGLTAQTSAAINLFERRGMKDREITMKNLGTTFALEITSHQSIIPSEKRALVDSGHYNVSIHDPEMLYLAEHWDENGVEKTHEHNVVKAVSAVLDEETEHLIEQGVDDFLNSVSELWDLLDSALLVPVLNGTTSFRDAPY
jgi:hypothetical protein